MAARTPPGASGTQAVDRAALLVATVVQADEPLSFADLVDECDLPKSTASRLLAALERTDLLERTEEGSFVAGPLFWVYASRHDPWGELARLARPVLEEITEITGETVNLGTVRGDRVVHVAQVDSTRYVLGARDWTQVEVPPHVSALGKVLYAYDALLVPEDPLPRVTERSLASVSALRRQLRDVRVRGFATTVDELELGLAGVAAPVPGKHSKVVAAVGISGPTQRLEDRLDGWGELLTARAEELSTLFSARSREEGVA